MRYFFLGLSQANPLKSLLFITALLGLSGCSLWPSVQHREVTMESIEAAVQACIPEPVQLSCPDMTEVEAGQARLQQQLAQLEARLQQPKPEAIQPVAAKAKDQAPTPEGKVIIGSLEWIYLTPPNHHYRARIDSGATTSSLSAVDIVKFERDGERWVRFKVQHDEDDGFPSAEVEAPLVRHVRIRQSSADEIDRRPVVRLMVRIGPDLQADAEFSLTDRSQMTYPILLGREFLQDITLIDVGSTYLHPKFNPEAAMLELDDTDKALVDDSAVSAPDLKDVL